MRFQLRLCACILFLAVSPSWAATPSLEELHQLLLIQQTQIQEQAALLKSMQQQIQSQQRQILAQEASSATQQKLVVSLQDRAIHAESELELVHASLLAVRPDSSASAQPDADNPYLTKAGPMTASLVPAGTPKQVEHQPFNLSARAEYLLAASDSFRFTNSTTTVLSGYHNTISSNGHSFSPGYVVSAEYDASADSPALGIALHYWEEADTIIRRRDPEDNMSITLGAQKISAYDVTASTTVRRFYGDAYGRGEVASGSSWQLGLSAGLRYGSLSQSITAKNANAPSNYVESTARYWGVGPRLGADLNWEIPSFIDIVAEADVAMLIGQSHSAAKSVVNGGPFASKYAANFDTAWMANSRLGMEYDITLPSSLLDFGFGLNTEYWTGIPDHSRISHMQDSPTFDDTSMLLIGPYFEIGWSF